MIFLILVLEIIDDHFWEKGPMEEEPNNIKKVEKENSKVKNIGLEWQE